MAKLKKFSFIFILVIAEIFLISGFSFGVGFEDKLRNLKWIAYSPTNYNPNKEIYPELDSIKKDLEVLRSFGATGIITYGAMGVLGEIPRLAKEAGFEGVIMGIWDIENRSEIVNVTLAKDYADGYCVGNEGYNKRYDLEALAKAIKTIKEATNRPATFTEEVFDYSSSELLELGDWIFPNIHPFACEIKDPAKGVAWLIKHYQYLQKKNTLHKPIIFKETGFHTRGGKGANQANQKKYFNLLLEAKVPFVYFEAFDQNWKRHASYEPYWGLFDAKRRPKKFVSGWKTKK